ncbi:MAG: LPS assembly lipoprotein LptE [Nibricoccus sp.]
MRIHLSVAMRKLLPFCVAVFLALSTGCAHYQLGTEGKLSFHTLYVAPVQNKAYLPQAVAVVTTQIREAFIHDGRVSLVNSAAEAEAVLNVTVVSYRRDVTTARPDDTGLARKFNLTLTASCTLREKSSDAALFENRVVTVEQQIFATATPAQVDSNQIQAEYQALPQLAAKLADKIAHASLDVW